MNCRLEHVGRRSPWSGCLCVPVLYTDVSLPQYHAFKTVMDIAIPDRPEYGSFEYKTLVREPQVTST